MLSNRAPNRGPKYERDFKNRVRSPTRGKLLDNLEEVRQKTIELVRPRYRNLDSENVRVDYKITGVEATIESPAFFAGWNGVWVGVDWSSRLRGSFRPDAYGIRYHGVDLTGAEIYVRDKYRLGSPPSLFGWTTETMVDLSRWHYRAPDFAFLSEANPQYRAALTEEQARALNQDLGALVLKLAAEVD